MKQTITQAATLFSDLKIEQESIEQYVQQAQKEGGVVLGHQLRSDLMSELFDKEEAIVSLIEKEGIEALESEIIKEFSPFDSSLVSKGELIGETIPLGEGFKLYRGWSCLKYSPLWYLLGGREAVVNVRIK